MAVYRRNVDELGRVVLPAEARKKLGLSESGAINITVEENRLTITPATPLCKLCGTDKNINTAFGICSLCIEKIKKL